MSLLTQSQIERLRSAIYEDSKRCYNCIPSSETDNVWVVAIWTLADAIEEAFDTTSINEEINFSIGDNADQIIAELALRCPNCGMSWTAETDQLSDSYDPATSPGVTDNPASYQNSPGGAP